MIDKSKDRHADDHADNSKDPAEQQNRKQYPETAELRGVSQNLRSQNISIERRKKRGQKLKLQRAEWIIEETNILNDYLGGFVKGKLLDSLIIGLICKIGRASCRERV